MLDSQHYCHKFNTTLCDQKFLREFFAEMLVSSNIMVTLPSQTHSRVKRFDPSDFDDAETEDVPSTGCPDGSITNSDDTCTECTAGTYANTDASPQVCTACPLDKYSGSKAKECTACASGKGTLEEQSDSADDCIGMFELVISLALAFYADCR